MAHKRYREKNNRNNKDNHDVLGIVLVIISLFLLLCIAIPPILGVFSKAIFNVVLGVFGVAAYPTLVAFIVLGVLILLRRGRAAVKPTVCTILLVIFSLMILQLASTHHFLNKGFSDYIATVYDFKFTAGGVIFGTLAFGLKAVITEIACYIIFSVAIIVTIIVMTDIVGRIRARRSDVKPEPPAKKQSDFALRGEARKVVPIEVPRELYVGTVVPHTPEISSETGNSSDIPMRSHRSVTDYGALPVMEIEHGFDDKSHDKSAAVSAIYGDAAAINKEETENFSKRFKSEESAPYSAQSVRADFKRSDTEVGGFGSGVYGVDVPVSQSASNDTNRPARVDFDGTPGALQSLFFPAEKQIEFNDDGIENLDEIRSSLKANSSELYRNDFTGYSEPPRTAAPIFRPDYSSAPLAPVEEIIDATSAKPAPEPEEKQPEPISFDDKYIQALDRANAAKLERESKPEPQEEIIDAFEQRDRFVEDENILDDDDFEADIINGSSPVADVKNTPEPIIGGGDIITDKSDLGIVDGSTGSSLIISDAPALDLSEKHDITSDIIAGEDLSGMYVSTDEEDEIAPPAPIKPAKKKASAPLENQITLDSVLKEKADESVVVSEQKRHKKYNYMPPPIDLLKVYPKSELSRDELEARAQMLETVVGGYLKAEVKVINIVPGPTVTRYELEVPSGVAIKAIEARSADIEYELAAKSHIRIEAPIPGKRAVGIEVPNAEQSIVGLREIIESSKFAKAKSPLTVSVGKDIAGDIVLCNLEKVPHLLIAGQTGSGKSACLNGLLVSLLYKSSPEDLRFILIDPKRVEFSKYASMPHLLFDRIIVEPQEALNALKWAANEMERRYTILQKYTCSQLSEFNSLPEVTNGTIDKIPHVIIIVDELADLMASQFKGEIENRIMVIAAKARAAGIHLIVATQRPSADVITGTIKTNLTSRIAFKVSAQIDSRIILDTAGAEALVGMGDMLFYPVDFSSPARVQGSYIAGDEVAAVVGYVKDHFETDFDESASKYVFGGGNGGGAGGGEAGGNTDALLPRVLAQAVTAKQISTSVIQRRFSIGYARAARIMDTLEDLGYIGPSVAGNKPREVLLTPEQFRAEYGDAGDEA